MAMKIGAITLDCNDLDGLAGFYSELTGREVRRMTDPDSSPYVVLADPDGGADLSLQKVAEPRRGKNRAHVDFAVADVDKEASRAVELGATYVEKYFGDDGWIWMTDPEGNEFCLCKA